LYSIKCFSFYKILQKHITGLLTEYGENFPPQKFKTHVSKRNKGARGKGVYIGLDEPDKILGEVRMAKAWNPLGHEVSDVLDVRCRLLTKCRE
jgi:hypothetical protein